MAAANFSNQLPSGYTFALCNHSTSQTHSVTSVSIRIDLVVPYTGQLSEWPGCTHAYTRSQLPGAVGCGNPLDDYLQASFPAHPTVGSIAMATQVSTSYSGINGYPPPPLSPMPVALAPGQGLIIAVDPVIPGAAATYTFTLGVAVDTAAAAFVSPAPPVLLAPVAHDFTGNACQTAAMQAQIPTATTQVVFYVCPVA
jgi:hypothetical protein